MLHCSCSEKRKVPSASERSVSRPLRLKLRGDKIEDVYKDYQLKGLLLASLHPEAWGEWCRIRQLTSTMPITFEAVEIALLEEESARVLSRLKDPYSDVLPTAAHGTTTTESLPPTSCSDCGGTFSPGRPSHHRCSPCQKKFTAEKKKRRDTTKSGKGATRGDVMRIKVVVMIVV